MMKQDCILEIKGLDKRFGPTHANKNISMTVSRGEIRGLAGENGSGKSTLLSQVAGIMKKDAGTFWLDGKPYDPQSVLEANQRGIAMVVQELGLVNSLPAAINIFLGKTRQFSRLGIISTQKIYKAINDVLGKWDLPPIDKDIHAGEMSVESRKMVEIARALANDPQILILDEVTQALSHDNRLKLYDLIRRFKAMGRTVIMITHDLEEIVDIADTISILRDGELITTQSSDTLTLDSLKTRMVGRELAGEYYRKDEVESYEADVIIKVEHVSTEDGLSDISFELHRGEILGFCGLSDSGIHTIGQMLYGLADIKSGRVSLTGQKDPIRSQTQALKQKLAYVPKDRDSEALMMNASIRENLTMPSLVNYSGTLGYLSGRQLDRVSREAVKAFNVKCTGIDQPMTGLSGGNKQKVNLGRWLIKDLDVLIVDCPTRGVDVGVKSYLYQMLKDVKAKGVGIILITDELPEAIGMSDNIIIMKNGQIKGSLPRSSKFSEESIVEVMI